MRLLGARVVEAGYCTIEASFSEDVTQQNRHFHGAVIGAVGDNAAGTRPSRSPRRTGGC